MKNKNICMISCTLSIDDKMVKVWNELAEALDKNDYKLLMLVTSVHPDMNFDYVQIPFTLDEFDQLQIEIKDTHYNDENLTALEMTEREIEWFGKNRNDWWNHYRGYFKCKSFYRSFIQSVKPSLIIAWQNSLPQSNILKRLAEEYSIPNLIMERGMLPDSFMLEKSGNVALSDIVNNFSIRKVIKDSTAKNDYDKIKEFYRTNKPTKYSQRSLNESQILLDEFNLKEIPTLVYFANMDSSVGLYPYDSNLSKKTSVEFNNTKKVINSLLSYAKKHSLNISVKLHPHDNNDYSEYELEEIRILRDFDYHLLMEKADLLAFSSTTLQFESLIYEKPVILFNNSELCGFNIGYEVQSLQNLFKVITEAVNKDQLETRLDNAKRFLHWAANYFLFSYYENTPIKNNLFDMADYFAEIGINDNSLNFEKKLNRLEKFLKSLKYKNTVSLKLDSGIIECENDNTVIGEYEDDLEELKILMEKLESGELIPELFEQSGKIFSRYDEKITADKYFDHSTILRERIRSEKEEEDSLINNSYEFIKHEYDGYVTAKNYFDAYLLIESKLRINSSDPKLNSLQTELIETISKRKKEKKWDVNKSVKALQNADKYFNSNNLKDAKNKLLEVLNLEPLHIEAINNLSVLSISENNNEYAIKLIEYVLSLEENNYDANENKKYMIENGLYGAILSEENEYNRKLQEEVNIYGSQINVHELPNAHHIYSSNVITKSLEKLTGQKNFNSWCADEIDKLSLKLGRKIHGLSIGCGNGDTEIDVMKKIINKDLVHLTGLDINPAMVERGNAMLFEAGIDNMDFKLGDFNFPKFEKKYDFFFANHSLHHVTELENLFESIKENSSDEMIFLINDMIGRNGHVLWNGSKELVDEIWGNLDIRYRYNAYTKEYDNEVMNHNCSTEGFEGIRAEDIIPLLISYFDFDIYLPFSYMISRFIDRAYGHNFNLDDKNDLEIINKIIELEKNIADKNILSATQAFIKLKKKGSVSELKYMHQTPIETIANRQNRVNLSEYSI